MPRRKCNATVEELARRGHRRWLIRKQSAGVMTHRSELGDELMLEWEQLTERAREMNRDSIRGVLTDLAEVITDE